MGDSAIQYMRPADAAAHSVHAAVHLRDHAAGDDAVLHQSWHVRQTHLGDQGILVVPVPEQTPDIGQQNQFFRAHRHGNFCRRSIRVYIVAGFGIQSLGDPGELRLRLGELEERRSTLQTEYDAIATAMEVLALSYSTLQTRFSPALGEAAASIFTNLTGGRYNKVLLDQDLRPSAQETGQFVAHDVPFLSQGAADQLYLAVRLAICDMVLPADRACPVLLDDALVNFDDQRMAAALDYLLELSERRQVLLFTCQRREGEYLRWACPDRFHCVRLQG